MRYLLTGILFATLLFVPCGRSDARVIPEIRTFLDEELEHVGTAMVANEEGLTRQGRKFRFETFALRLRALFGFDAASTVNIQLIPEVELFFEREPEKVP